MPRVPRLIASQVFLVFRPALLAYFLLSTINFVLGSRNTCSYSGTLVISALSAPFWFIFSLYLEEFRRKLRAWAHGAVLPTTIPYRWPGGLDVLTSIARNKDAYIGEGPSAYSSILGPTFRLYTMFEGRVFTAEPAYIKSILATDFDNFEKGELNRTQMDVLLGDGVFNSDSDVWKFHRSMTRPFFNRDRISHFEIFNRHVDDSIAQAKRRMGEGYPFDFQDMVSRFTLDSATEFLLGKNVESLSAGLPYPHYADADLGNYNHPANVFTRAFVEAQSAVATRIRYSSLWTLLELGGEKARKHMEVIDAFVEPILAEAINRAKHEELDAKVERRADQADQDADTLLDHLVRFTRDPKMLKDETLNIMIAGRDTTASTLTFIVYMLSQHPHVMDHLYEEIHQLLPNNERPTFEDIKGMKYMRAVINETLRLYPPVPFNIRSATADTIWKSTDPSKPALFIPKGVRCILSPLLMHRRTDLWGPDALDFDPDRFLDERVHKYLVPNPFIFLPFNAGPRICLGQQFAYNEASFMLIRLVQEFSRIHLAPEAQPPETLPPAQWKDGPGRKAVEKIRLKSHLTMYSMGGLWVTMEERKSSP